MFSRNLRVINREEEAQIAQRKEQMLSAGISPPPPPAPTLSKVQKAREYAKAVPKPRPRPSEPSGGSPGKGSGAEGAAEAVTEEMDALALLEKQHAEHKEAAARIRAELGL